MEDQPITYNMDREGNFIDPRAETLFNAWCNEQPQNTLVKFFDFVATP